MKRFTEAGRECLKEGNLYAALVLALALPDICGSLEVPGPRHAKARYIAWCKKWVEPKFTIQMLDGPTVFVSAEDCYQIRCSLIHSGSSTIEPSKRQSVDRFEFFDDTTSVHLVKVGGRTPFLQLMASRFSEELFNAAEEWDAATSGDPKIQDEESRLLVIHSKGTTIGGISFG